MQISDFNPEKVVDGILHDFKSGKYHYAIIKVIAVIASIIIIMATSYHALVTLGIFTDRSLSSLPAPTPISTSPEVTPIVRETDPCRSGIFENISVDGASQGAFSLSSSSKVCVLNASIRNSPKGIEIRD